MGMSLPLLFSFQLKTPPESLQGVSFIAIWTWAVIGAIAVPVLGGLEVVACVVCFRHNPRSGALPFHAVALAVAVVAELMFVAARRS
jgi:anaerobic C4-dicarboxylate transporter